jgi:hypothetical protein
MNIRLLQLMPGRMPRIRGPENQKRIATTPRCAKAYSLPDLHHAGTRTRGAILSSFDE